MNKHRKPSLFIMTTLLENAIMQIGNIQGIIFTSFLLFLDIPVAKIGVLISFLGLCQLLQVFSTLIYQRYPNKKRIILAFRFIRTLMMVLTALIPSFISRDHYFYALAILILLRFSFMNLTGGAFLEWNDHYIDEGSKGKYYGIRNVLGNALSIVLSFTFGLLLDRFDGIYPFYIVLFAVPVLFNLMEWQILRNIPFPATEAPSNRSFISELITPLKDRDYQRFIGFTLLWIFSNGIGRPLVNLYAVKYLDYTYTVIALVGSMAAFVKLGSGVFFGSMIDRRDSHYVIRLTGIGYGLTAFLFVFMSPGNPLVFAIAVVMNGIFMIGFNVSKFRFNMMLSKGPLMNTYLSVNAFFIGLGTFLSANISALVIGLFGDRELQFIGLHLNSYQLLFLASGILNLVAVYYFIRNFMKKEPIYDKIQGTRISQRT